MIYVQNQATGRAVQVTDEAEIPEGWSKADSLLCSFCQAKPVNEDHSDWYITIVCGYRYCSKECRQAHLSKGDSSLPQMPAS